MTLPDFTDSAQTQAVLAMLLAETSRELQAWIASQQDLCAQGTPLDDPAWGHVRMQPAPAVQPPARHETVRHEPPRQTTAAPQTSGATMSMFKSLRKAPPKPQLYTTTERMLALEVLAAKAGACRQCLLGCKRQGIFAGYGPADAKIMFIAAGGNPKELETGRIMTGEAGEMLDRIVAAMAKLSPIAEPERIYMTNVLKCAHVPPRPQALEAARKCLPVLREEIAIVAPKVIIIWGEFAFRAMFGNDALISQVRGQVFKFEGISAIPTHHPMEMVKNPKLKGRTWADLQAALEIAKS